MVQSSQNVNVLILRIHHVAVPSRKFPMVAIWTMVLVCWIIWKKTFLIRSWPSLWITQTSGPRHHGHGPPAWWRFALFCYCAFAPRFGRKNSLLIAREKACRHTIAGRKEDIHEDLALSWTAARVGCSNYIWILARVRAIISLLVHYELLYTLHRQQHATLAISNVGWHFLHNYLLADVLLPHLSVQQPSTSITNAVIVLCVFVL
jgi:hypothetical protein